MIITQKKPLLHVEQQGRFLAVAHSTGKSASGTRGERKKIIQFSRRSRKNLLDRIARMTARNALHITLTYKENYQDHKAAFEHLRRFMQMLGRLYDDAPIMWRKELQQRGAIHFHLLVHSKKFVPKPIIVQKWEQATDGAGGFSWLQFCASARQVGYYVSKYVAKMPDEPQPDDSLLDTATKLHTGRWWGIYNRKNISYPPMQYIELPGHRDEKTALKTWARYVRRLSTSNRVDYRTGWTLYLESAQDVYWYLVADLAN